MPTELQENEAQCQDCAWWKRRGEGSNACFPRAITFVMSPINKTAMPAHKSTFDKCPYRTIKEKSHVS